MGLKRYCFANYFLIPKDFKFKRKRIISIDTRLNHMPLMGSPIPMLLLVSIYLLFVGMGKKWMEHRPPVRIDRIIIVYNIVQIIANSALVLMVGSFVEKKNGHHVNAKNHLFFYSQATNYIFIHNTNFSFVCGPPNFSTDPDGMYEAYVGYSYFILKLIDYLDTVFFILRKKWAHVSFLHVYHHVMMSIVTLFGLLYVPGSYINKLNNNSY